MEAAIEAGDDEEATARRVTERVQDYLPGDALLFLTQLSIEPVRARLAAAAR